MSDVKWLKTVDGRIIEATPHLIENARKFKLQPSEAPADAEPKKDEPNPEKEELAAEYEAKFGKKPHHKLTVERIREELAKDAT